jgi:hypothetical protein
MAASLTFSNRRTILLHNCADVGTIARDILSRWPEACLTWPQIEGLREIGPCVTQVRVEDEDGIFLDVATYYGSHQTLRGLYWAFDKIKREGRTSIPTVYQVLAEVA